MMWTVLVHALGRLLLVANGNVTVVAHEFATVLTLVMVAHIHVF